MTKIKQKWKKDLDLLSSKQSAKYDDSLEVIGLMRQGMSLNQASKLVGISPSTVKRYVGTTLKLKNKRIIARKNDSLLRKIRIYENGKEEFIQIRGRKNSAIVAQYLGAVGRRIDKNDTTALESFEKITIRDFKGNHHRFETDIKKLIRLFEKREEPEFFKIYRGR
ncbi:helix-turn-helix transcriptional regulator [Nitrosopumilus sp.]|uniref:helix-turn-helix transcriptional regulator n=1 Tax=Nitrosopumilus sp. TaxID=2024843 RepID=UPI0034A0057D